MIHFNGKSSDELHVIVEHYPARPIPKRKMEKWSVAGRSGDVLAPEDAWENVEMSYEVYISAEKLGLPRVAAKVVEWLTAPGYHPLADDYDIDCFRMASFTGGESIRNYSNLFGRFTLSFDCWPQRFLADGARAVSVPQGGLLVNPTAYEAEPLIVVQGSGEGALLINDTEIRLDDCAGVTLDCREEEAWRGVSNLNTAVRGDYPKLRAGENRIAWSGGISAVAITPRWYVL